MAFRDESRTATRNEYYWDVPEHQLFGLIVLIICPIAIAYSMGQIIKSVFVCQCVSVSVCEHSHGRIS